MGNVMRKPRILVLAGSTRKDSIHRKLARLAVEALHAVGVDATFADLRDYTMPVYDGDLEAEQGLPPAAKALKELARSSDGFVIASPEYNGSFPAVLKNSIDWISRPEPGERSLEVFRGKVAAILSASPGPGGGRRVLKHLRELLEMIGVSVIPQELSIARAGDAIDQAGRLVRLEDIEGLAALAGGLARSLAARNEAAA
jgi:chromate reductase, NAD(P)H dehydrogenase (quinone)